MSGVEGREKGEVVKGEVGSGGRELVRKGGYRTKCTVHIVIHNH